VVRGLKALYAADSASREEILIVTRPRRRSLFAGRPAIGEHCLDVFQARE